MKQVMMELYSGDDILQSYSYYNNVLVLTQEDTVATGRKKEKGERKRVQTKA